MADVATSAPPTPVPPPSATGTSIVIAYMEIDSEERTYNPAY